MMLALHRIQHGRAHTKVTEITFLNVAEEAGVSAALIHNNHATTVGVAIREAQGRTWKQARDAMRQEIKDLKAQAREFQKELKLVKEQRRKLATLNEVLTRENEVLRAVKVGHVTALRR
ncbi:TetR family transcriptional regulator [Acidovorax sp. SDU_ACID1]|uniref:TetR family transcriptional regulator n=1 Tax=Acidovorax sp. SDU_ACID1 TaxID=3136632 RepID=UPI003872C9E5